MYKCPECGFRLRRRISRNFLLNLIPKSKFYKCFRCKTIFLTMLYLLSSVVFKKGKRVLEREVVVENNLE